MYLHGVHLMISAKIVKGKKIAGYYALEDDIQMLELYILICLQLWMVKSLQLRTIKIWAMDEKTEGYQ